MGFCPGTRFPPGPRVGCKETRWCLSLGSSQRGASDPSWVAKFLKLCWEVGAGTAPGTTAVGGGGPPARGLSRPESPRIAQWACPGIEIRQETKKHFFFPDKQLGIGGSPSYPEATQKEFQLTEKPVTGRKIARRKMPAVNCGRDEHSVALAKKTRPGLGMGLGAGRCKGLAFPEATA